MHPASVFGAVLSFYPDTVFDSDNEYYRQLRLAHGELTVSSGAGAWR